MQQVQFPDTMEAPTATNKLFEWWHEYIQVLYLFLFPLTPA